MAFKVQFLCLFALAAQVLAMRSSAKLRGGGKMLTHDSGPPLPYHYETMIAWLKNHLSEETDVRMKPELAWFDVDGALQDKKTSWFADFKPQDIKEVADAVKKINRFHFMKKIMASGDDHTQSSLPLHILVLLLLKPKLHNVRPDGHVKVIDIGSGTGFLSAAFTLLADKGAEVYGLDCGSEVSESQSLINDKYAMDGDVHKSSDYPKIVAGDYLNLQSPLPKAFDLADAINVGLAVSSSNAPELQRVSQLLKPGGFITAPIVDQSCAAQDVRCHAKFTLLEKTDTGLVEKFTGPSVKFIQGGRCPDQ